MITLETRHAILIVNDIMSKHFTDDKLKKLRLVNVEFTSSGENGITFAKSGDDTFMLNAPIACKAVEVRPDGSLLENTGQILLRSVISYTVIQDLISGGLSGYLNFIQVITGMLKTVAAVVDFNQCKKITFNRRNGDYLRELENQAGYEIRLYVEI